MPKQKPNKGLLKRIRITKSGKIKHGRAGGRHLRSHKSGKLLRSYRKKTYAPASEARRLGAMLFLATGRKADDKSKGMIKNDTDSGTES